MAEVVALGVVDAVALEQRRRFVVCDELGDRLFAQALAIATIAAITSWSVVLAVQPRTNSPSILR